MPPRSSRGSSKDCRALPCAKRLRRRRSSPGIAGRHVARLVLHVAVPLELSALRGHRRPNPRTARRSGRRGPRRGASTSALALRSTSTVTGVDRTPGAVNRSIVRSRCRPVEVAEGVAEAAADAPAVPQVVGQDGVELVDPDLDAAVEEAAGEEPGHPVEAVVEGGVEADPEGEGALFGFQVSVDGEAGTG